MSFSNEWEQSYSQGHHNSTWPWSDLVSFVMRYSRPTSKKFRVLELGCGAGANIGFFMALEVDYFAMEGSPSIVKKLHERFPHLKDKIIAEDFTEAIPFEGKFDLIVDRSSITHNSTKSIRNCLEILKSKMRPGAKFIGIDWFSTAYSEFKRGKKIDDEFTLTDFPSGPFHGVGKVHFFKPRASRGPF